jgi:hypothetical protein
MLTLRSPTRPLPPSHTPAQSARLAPSQSHEAPCNTLQHRHNSSLVNFRSRNRPPASGTRKGREKDSLRTRFFLQFSHHPTRNPLQLLHLVPQRPKRCSSVFFSSRHLTPLTPLPAQSAQHPLLSFPKSMRFSSPSVAKNKATDPIPKPLPHPNNGLSPPPPHIFFTKQTQRATPHLPATDSRSWLPYAIRATPSSFGLRH